MSTRGQLSLMLIPQGCNDTPSTSDELETRKRLRTSALMRELPWATTFVFLEGHISASFDSTLWEAFAAAVEVFETKYILQGRFENFRAHLRVDEEPSYVLTDGAELPNLKFYETARVLFTYKLLDTAKWMQDLKKDDRAFVVPRRGTLPETHLPQLGYPILAEDWTQVLSTGADSLSQYISKKTPPEQSFKSDVAVRLFSSAAGRGSTIRSAKILRNLEVAAFHIAYLQKGHFDLPDEYSVLQQELNSFTDCVFIDAHAVDSDMKNMRKLRLPLQMALATSPISLFLSVNYSSREADRLTLLKTWAHLGGAKPATLEKAEALIWYFLFSLASGESPKIKDLIESLRSILSAPISLDERKWFNSSSPISTEGDYDMDACTPGPSVSTPNSSPSSPKMAESAAAGPKVDNLLDHRSSTEDSTSRGTPSPTDHAARTPPPQEYIASESQPSDPPSVSERRFSARRVAPLTYKSMAPKENWSKRKPNTNGKGKRKLSEDGPPPFVSVSQYVIDLTADLDESPIESVDLSLDFHKKLTGERAVELHTVCGTAKVTPRFHFQKDLDRFYAFINAADAHNIGGQPLYKAATDISSIRLLSEADLNSGDDVGKIFAKQHILSKNDSGKSTNPSKFTIEALLEIASEKQILHVNDMSIDPPKGALDTRLRRATIREIYNHSQAPDGKALNAVALPLEHSPPLPSPLASDRYAWRHTYDKILCKRSDRYPASAMGWALVSTAGTYSPWRIGCEGLCSAVEVQNDEGMMLWFVAVPKYGASGICSLDQFLHKWDIEDVCSDRWNIEAFLLTPGVKFFMRPNTPHFVITLENTICYGSHFYATSTIRDSCYGLMHSFMAPSLISDIGRESETRELLRRLVTYYHMIYESTDYPDCSTKHAIDIRTFDGFVDFLTLHNTVELFNVLYSRSYYTGGISGREHLDFVEARRLCRTIFQWFTARYCIVKSGDLSMKPIPVEELRDFYLEGQIRALIRYQALINEEVPEEIFDSPNVNDVWSMIKICIANGPEHLEKYNQLLKVKPDDHFFSSISWPPSIRYEVKFNNLAHTSTSPLPPDGHTPGDYLYRPVGSGGSMGTFNANRKP